jgi:Flp pilus assembly protein TadG
MMPGSKTIEGGKEGYMNLGWGRGLGRSRLGEALWRSTNGSALVEASILTPILIVLFFGVFEFAWYFQNQQLVEIGVRDAARYLARGPYVSAFSSEGTNPCLDATNVAAAKNLAVTGTNDGSGGVRVKGWTTANVTILCGDGTGATTPIDNSAHNYAGPSAIYIVTVSTSFADPALGYFGLLSLGTPNLSASHNERAFGSG